MLKLKIYISTLVVLLMFFQEHECFLFKKKTNPPTTITSSTAKNPTTLNVTGLSTTSKAKTSKPATNKLLNTTVSRNTGYTLLRIADGDTIIVRKNSDKKEVKIRFRCVDAPEKSQDWGPESAKTLSSFLKPNSQLSLEKTSKDLYERTLGEVINQDGINVNKRMVEIGWAVWYPFQSGCKDYELLESQAKKNKVGLWNDKKFELPWVYRKRVGIGKFATTSTKTQMIKK